ncbi:hypothetical protein BDN72DRAFT_816400 [Pluteus cervinus]|uniref:Uncharacterized protein n=1 Tax=Pluteus cervinus TaxID=181527 RepID=A0ACD3B2D3_9AGAR|nr:hypothetical protein BDN72DRAFT_816400 [Pluteus cervinus]
MTFASASRAVAQNARQLARHIELKGLPRTATPADIKRAITRINLKGVSDVAIDYYYFTPTERALLTLSNPKYMEENLQALKDFEICGHPIESKVKVIEGLIPQRQRGVKGRKEAAQRGFLTGNGPHAGLPDRQRNVTLWGFPGKIDVEAITPLLDDFGVARNEAGEPNVVKIQPPQGAFTMVSRFLVTLSTETEAHRMVRQLHFTHWMPDVHGTRYILRARIIY